MRVLVTGAAASISPGVVRALARRFELRLVDLARSEELAGHDWATGSILDPEFLSGALEGVEAVVNLAVVRKRRGADVPTERVFDVNVKGLYILLESAAKAGVRRFVHMSSTAMVIGRWHEAARITVESPFTTRGRYSLTKAIQEVICEHFARNSEMTIVALRPWAPCDRGTRRRYHPGLVDTEDLGEACGLAIEAGGLGRFEVFHITATREARERFDAERTERLLGFRAKRDFHELLPGGNEPPPAGETPGGG